MLAQATLRRLPRAAFFLALLPLVSSLIFVYPFVRLAYWYMGEMPLGWPLALVLCILPAAGLWAGFRWRLNGVKSVLVNWLGVGFIFFCVVILYELFRLPAALIWSLSDRQMADAQMAFVLVVTAVAICVYAGMIARTVCIRDLTIHSSKIKKRVRVVQITDVHIGSRTAAFMQKIVAKVTDLRPDYLVITGDFIDTSQVTTQDINSLREVDCPIYYVTGNHDRYCDLNYVIPMLESVNVIPLRNQTVRLPEFDLVGIDDADDKQQVAKVLPTIKRDQSKFNLLLYHRPDGWESAIAHGIDLMLCGHTHNGQIVPFNWLVKRHFELIKGLHQRNESWLYVSPGTGTWGPVMRLGSRNEITCIELTPAPDCAVE